MSGPSNPAEQRIWDLYHDEIEAVVASSPPLTAQQIREIRAALLSPSVYTATPGRMPRGRS